MPLQLNSIILLHMVIIRIDSTTYTDDNLFNPSRPFWTKRKIQVNIFVSHFFVVPQKVLLRPFFMKPFDVPQRSVKIKFNFIFILIQLSEMHGTGRLKIKRF